MKRLLALMLGALLVMLAATVAMGAIHDSFGDFTNPMTIGFGGYDYKTGGGWFYIEKDDPFIQFNAATEDSNYWQVAGEYWKNDQTFVEGTLQTGDADRFARNNFRGSYLTDCGFFVGMNYYSRFSDASDTIFSPGYLFKFGDNAYIALSADYDIYSYSDLHSSYTSRDVLGYDVDFKLYGEKFKLYGQLYYEKDPKFTTANIAFNYKLADAFVVGGFYDSWAKKVYNYGFGFTFSPEAWLVDLKYTRFEDNSDTLNQYKFSTLYSIDEKIGVGFDYIKQTGDYLNWYEYNESTYTGIKATYKAFDGAFLLTYGTPSGKYIQDASLTLRFKKNLK